jgi:hypothetical protein
MTSWLLENLEIKGRPVLILLRHLVCAQAKNGDKRPWKSKVSAAN